MKLMSLVKVVLSIAIVVSSVTFAKAATAFGFINLTIYGYLLNPSPTSPTTIVCSGQLIVVPTTASPTILFAGSNVSKGTSVIVPANTQTFQCHVNIPYYFNNIPTGAGLSVGFNMQNFSSTASSTNVMDFQQPITPIPTNYVTTNVTAVALL